MRLLLLRFLAEHLTNHSALLLAVLAGLLPEVGPNGWLVKHISLGSLGLVFVVCLFTRTRENGQFQRISEFPHRNFFLSEQKVYLPKAVNRMTGMNIKRDLNSHALEGKRMAHRTGQDPKWSLATPDLTHTSQDVQDVGGRERCAKSSRIGMSRDEEVGSLMFHWVRGESV